MASGLTKGRVSSLVLLCSIISLLIVSAAVALHFAPGYQAPAAADIVSATPRDYQQPALEFTPYSSTISTRSSPFDYGVSSRVSVAMQSPPSESPPVVQQPPPPAPVPQPDTDDLQLVGTMPGSRLAFALILDQSIGQVMTVAVGESVRNAVLASVNVNSVQLQLNNQFATLQMAEATNPQTTAPQPSAQPQNRPANSRPSGQSGGGTPTLGLSGYLLSNSEIQSLGLTQDGLRITSIRNPNTDVQIDDVLVEVDGQAFSSILDVLDIISTMSPGTQVPVQVIRKKSPISAVVELQQG